MHDPSSLLCVARSPPLTNSRAIKREPRRTKKASRARFGRSPFLDSCSAFIASFLRFPVVHAFDGRERESDLRPPTMDIVLCVSYQFPQIGRLSRSASTTVMVGVDHCAFRHDGTLKALSSGSRSSTLFIFDNHNCMFQCAAARVLQGEGPARRGSCKARVLQRRAAVLRQWRRTHRRSQSSPCSQRLACQRAV